MFEKFKKYDKAVLNAATIVAGEFNERLKEHALSEKSEKDPWIEIWLNHEYSKEILDCVANIFWQSGWYSVAYCNTERTINEITETGVSSWYILDNSSLILFTKEALITWESSSVIEQYSYRMFNLRWFFKSPMRVMSPEEYFALKKTTCETAQ